MDDRTVIEENIWQAKVERAEEEYLARIGGPAVVIENVGPFMGLLSHVNKRVFRSNKPGFMYGEIRSCIDIHDMRQLYNALDTFVELCEKYNHMTAVNTLTFGTYSGISVDVFIRWKDGSATPEHCEFVKMIDRMAESKLAFNVSEKNSIGSMFLLKSKFSYVESKAPEVLEVRQAAPQISKTDITALLDTDME